MTIINEFYPNKMGRACHMDLGDLPQFLLIGINVFNQCKTIYKQSISHCNQKFSTFNVFNDLSRRVHDLSFKPSKSSIIDGLIVGTSFATLAYGVVSSPIEKTSIPSLIHNEQLNENQNLSYIDKDVFLFKKSDSVFKSKTEAFSKLLYITEGKSKIFYKDNSGIATLYGWNPTKTPKKLNLELSKAMGLNKKEQDAIEAVSSNPNIQYIPHNLKKIVFSDKQLKISVQFMMNTYEKELFNVMKIKSIEKKQDFEQLQKQYYELPYNQQAVLLHMVYKVGATNLLKYNDFFDTLFTYMHTPNIENLKSTSKSFEYSYMKHGEKLRDSNVEKKHEAFFINCLHSNNSPLNENISSCEQLVQHQEKTISKVSKRGIS